MTVTMAQIDEARGSVMEALDFQRARDAGWAGIFPSPLVGLSPAAVREEIERRRARVDLLLREWWAQGCREAIVAVPVRHVRHDDGTQSILMSDGVRFHSRDGGGTWYAAEGGSDA